MLRELRQKRDLRQEEVVEAVAALELRYGSYDVRTLRRYECGEICPKRTLLILTVVRVYKQTDPEIVNRILQAAHYDTLKSEEMSFCSVSQDASRITSRRVARKMGGETSSPDGGTDTRHNLADIV
jgi:hypothetical protein